MDTSLKTSSHNGNGHNGNGHNGNGHNGNRIYLAQSLPAQSLPWFEKQEDDWDLRQILGIVKRRALVIVVVITAVMAGVTTMTLKQKPQYEAQFRILAEPVNSDDSNLSKVTSVVEGKLEKSGLDYETQIQVLKSPELMANIIKQLQVSYPDLNYDSLVNYLTITRLGQTKIIEFRYQSDDPVKIKVVLDTLAKSYLKYSLDNRQTNLRQGILFVDKQLPSIQSRVNQLQQQLQQFRQQYEFIDPQTQSQQLANAVSTLAQQRLMIDQQLTSAISYYNSLQGTEGAKTVLRDAAVYQQLVSQFRLLETQIAYESTRFHNDSLPMQILREKREGLLPLLRQEAQRVWTLKIAEVTGQIKNLEDQSQVIAQAEKRLQQKIEQLPVLTRHYTELQRNLQLASESLNRFLTTRETLQIEAARTQVPWQIVQAPIQPSSPVSPNTQRNLMLGLVASTLLGIGGALLIEKLDNTYHTVDAFKDKLKLPMLATVPFERHINTHNRATSAKTSTANSANEQIQGNSQSSAIVLRVSALVEEYGRYESNKFLDALRVLYTNIQLLSSDQPIRSIVISSASPSEGKSTIAFNLAQTACAMGQRVLLVDTDLRRPRIHAMSDLNNLWGLSSIISGNMPVETVIRQLPSMTDLSILTAGPIPPDPIKLLSSQKMKQLMADFHQAYDLVIYDAPPLVGLADANLLAPHTDGLVLVTRMHRTDRSALSQAMDNLKMSRTNILGMVINGQRGGSSNYYKYY